jgi:hypothetical protein
MAMSMGTGTATTKVVKVEKIMPSITLKPRTTRRGIAATTSTWAIEMNISKDIELDIKAAMMTPIIIVRESSLRSMAVKTLASVFPEAPSEWIGHTFWELQHAVSCLERAGDFSQTRDLNGALIGSPNVKEHVSSSSDHAGIPRRSSHAFATWTNKAEHRFGVLDVHFILHFTVLAQAFSIEIGQVHSQSF